MLGAGTILSGDIHNFILCMVRIFMNQTLGTSLLFRTYFSTISSFLKVQWPFKITANTLTFAILKQMEYIYTRNTFFIIQTHFFLKQKEKKSTS